MIKKWQTVNKIKVHSNPYYEVWEHQIIRSNGKKGPYYVLETSINRKPFAVAVPLTDNRETYLVGQYRYPVGYYSWEFPMGHADKSSPLEVAKLELLEETGIKATDWERVGEFHTAPGYSSEIGHIFLGRNLSFGASRPSETEILEVKKVPLITVGKMITNGEIKDGPTIVAYHLLNSKFQF